VVTFIFTIWKYKLKKKAINCRVFLISFKKEIQVIPIQENYGWSTMQFQQQLTTWTLNQKIWSTNETFNWKEKKRYIDLN